MNELSSPLPADTVDELLSAELDGEFDAAAVDLGFTPVDARARLDATPGVDARRTALAAARDALTAPEEMEELLAARLRAKAVHAGKKAHDEHERARRTRRHKRLYAVAGIAAALAGVLAIVAAVTSTASHDKVNTSAAGAPTPSNATVNPTSNARAFAPGPGQLVGGYGSFATMNDLTNAIAATKTPPGLTYEGKQTTADVASPGTASSSAVARDRQLGAYAATGRCATVHDSLASGGTLASSGYAEIAGKPVLVRIYVRDGHRVITVTGTDCQQLASTVVR